VFYKAFCLSVGKGQKHIDGGKPGIKFIKATEHCSIFKNKQDYHTISGMSDIAVAEFVKYIDVIGPEAVRNSSMVSMTLTDIITLWTSTADWQTCTLLQLQPVLKYD